MIRYGVKVTETGSGLVFPIYNADGKVIAVKSLSLTTLQVNDVERKQIVSQTIPRFAMIFFKHLVIATLKFPTYLLQDVYVSGFLQSAF